MGAKQILTKSQIEVRLDRADGVNRANTALLMQIFSTLVLANPAPQEFLAMVRRSLAGGLTTEVKGAGAPSPAETRHAVAHINGVFDNLNGALFHQTRN